MAQHLILVMTRSEIRERERKRERERGGERVMKYIMQYKLYKVKNYDFD
jgi:hypothetical protein